MPGIHEIYRLPISMGSTVQRATLRLLAIIAIGTLAAAMPVLADINVPLELSIQTNSDVYHTGEPIDVTITLKNTSDAPVTVVNRLDFPHPELRMKITDANGHRLTWLPPIPPRPLGKEDFTKVSADEAIASTTRDIGKHLSDRPQPGTYSVVTTYTNEHPGKEFGLHAWTGSIISNTVVLTIEQGAS
jgi:hypothetical protein